ncbi:hypothetical protein [Antrihabitans spumae]|uniref:hypothetical protein n=1 Tax=Antrihabitans spumae TaxID=3373370 RepID=UPI0037518390
MPVGLGAFACLACCALPILVGAGLLGGGLASIVAGWLEPVGIALLALRAPLPLLGVLRSRRHGSSCAAEESRCTCNVDTAPHLLGTPRISRDV